MPLIELTLFEGRLTEETAPALIEKLTNVLVEVYGEGMRQHTTVLLQEMPARHWGFAGKPFA